MPNIYKELGENIRKFRKRKNLSTPDFAKKVGVSTGLVNNIEHGRSDVFKLELLFSITKELNVSIVQLLDIDSINIKDLALLEEINKSLKKNLDENNNNLRNLNDNLNKIIKAFILIASKYNCNENALNSITNHLVQELNFIQKIDNINSKVSF
ncbi:MAG: helix-turn-helix transcriptional regulator [Firmicutes bacterium]|nr:helix-turn-helix transcriptional regulator [Bacillota bacterium]